MNEVINSLKNRKSVRVYEDRIIAQGVKEAILDAAFQAPTAGNMMLYSIIDIIDQSVKETLSKTCDNQPFIASAPMLILVCADYQKYFDAFQEIIGTEVRKPSAGDLLLALSDALIAAQNMVVAAESFGIGSCYIGDIIENYEIHKEMFGLPEYALPIALICFGYPTEQQINRQKPKRFEKRYIVSQNKYHVLSSHERKEMFTTKIDKDYEEMITALYHRKYNSGFAKEMARSAKIMLESWLK